MKIAWITPFSRRSAIGRVSAAVTRLLWARGHQVTIIRSELRRSDPTPLHPTPLPVLWWHDLLPWDVDRDHDVIVANLGDHYGFHAGCLPFLDVVPCLGIFHDFFLYYFFYEWVRYNGFGEEVHNREIQLTYGKSVIDVARRAWRNPHSLDMIVDSIPMTEWLGRKCGAALTHSRFYVPRLEKSCPGPIATAPLSFDARAVTPLPDRADDDIVITTIGHMNQNKCADAVIKAIAASPILSKRCRYRLVGMITRSERARLETLCHEVGYDRINFLGEVNDAVLTAEIERADILSCLRKPVLEGASASAIEGMKSGRPLIVAATGFYADLPDDLVFKIPAAVDVPALTAVLEKLVQDKELRRQTGLRAKDWAMRTFTTEAYVDILEDLLAQFINAKPLLAVGKNIGQQLAELDISETDPSIERLGKKMKGLFGDGSEVPGHSACKSSI
jgi:glycosyltransferase involved in cell wall biosynthesis